ncbi:unnamed protein product [Lampetra fluviatilis]
MGRHSIGGQDTSAASQFEEGDVFHLKTSPVVQPEAQQCVLQNLRGGSPVVPDPISGRGRKGWGRMETVAWSSSVRQSNVSPIAPPDAGGGSAGVVDGCSARVGCPVAACSSTSPSGLKMLKRLGTQRLAPRGLSAWPAQGPRAPSSPSLLMSLHMQTGG